MRISTRNILISVLLTFLVGGSITSASLVSAQYYPFSQFEVNVTVNLPGAGWVTPGSGLYYDGATVVFTEYTNIGYSFDGWYLNGVYQGKLSSIPIIMTQDYQLAAVFSKRVVALTVTVNPTQGGITAPGMGVWNYTYGDSVVVKEFPNSGSTFEGWYLDGVSQGLGTTITVIMDRDHQLNAFFSGSQNNTEPPPTPTPTPTPTPIPPPNSSLPSPELQFFCTSSTTYSGFNVKIQGSLAYNGSGLPGTGILLSYSVTGGATWQDLAYVTTDNYGSFYAVWMPFASGEYVIKAICPGDAAYSTTSRTVNFAVAPFDNQENNVFSVTSNSTLTSLAFDSTKKELSFGVSGPSETSGYVQVCVPKSLLNDTSTLRVSLDDQIVSYNAILQGGDVWIITLMYSHSTHTIKLALDSTSSLPEPPTSFDLFGDLLGSQLAYVAIIAVLVVVIAVLIVMYKKKNK